MTAMILIGILYASGATSTLASRWTVIAFIEVFSVAFSASWGPTIRIYAVRLFGACRWCVSLI